MSESAKRVVITGLGIVSPLGVGIEPFEAGLKSGQSGIAPISLISYSAAPGGIGAEVKELTDETAKSKWLKSQRKNLNKMSWMGFVLTHGLRPRDNVEVYAR